MKTQRSSLKDISSLTNTHKFYLFHIESNFDKEKYINGHFKNNFNELLVASHSTTMTLHHCKITC